MSVQVPSNSILKPETGAKDVYLEKLLAQRHSLPNLNSSLASALQEMRDRAFTSVSSQRMPTRRDEEWQHTELASLIATNFVQAEATEASLEGVELPETANSRVVFVNGIYSPNLSQVSGLPEGVFVGNLAQLSESQSKDFVKHFAQVEGSEEVFTALNTASFGDVGVVWAKSNVIVETPIQLVFISVAGESPTVSHPRALILVEHNASVELVEHFVGSATYFTNAVTEIWVDENAQVKHTRVQQESETAFQIGKTAVSQAKDSRYTCCAVNFGGKLSRHNLEIWQKGAQTETNLYGLAMVEGEQVADTHSSIALNHPHGTPNQLHKCIIGDHAHSIFNGKVFVPKTAQLTNATQLNRNLLLSPKARVNTKPELQITADNVKCAHGATVSQLEADEIFYLRSRGLSEMNARHLLIDAFANEIFEKIPVASLRERLSSWVSRLFS